MNKTLYGIIKLTEIGTDGGVFHLNESCMGFDYDIYQSKKEYSWFDWFYSSRKKAIEERDRLVKSFAESFSKNNKNNDSATIYKDGSGYLYHDDKINAKLYGTQEVNIRFRVCVIDEDDIVEMLHNERWKCIYIDNHKPKFETLLSFIANYNKSIFHSY